MLSNEEIKIIEKLLLQSQSKLQYYTVIAVILVVLAWGLYFSLKRTGYLTIAIVMTIGLWYYPWRYYKWKLVLEADLTQKTKQQTEGIITDKWISKINRLEPYFYISTTEFEFEVDEMLFNSVKIGQVYQIDFTPHSQTIVAIKEVINE